MARTLDDDPYARPSQLPAPIRQVDVADAIVIDHVAPEFEARLQEPRPTPKPRPRVKRKLPIGSRGFRIAVAALCSVGAVAMMRAPIVAALPQFGATLPIEVSGLEFDRVRSETIALNGASALVVEGEIVNRSDREIGLPAVKIALRSPDGGIVKTWQFAPAKDSLAAGRSIGFRSSLVTPPTTATQVTLSLIGRDDAVGQR